ncbi:DNA repair protein RecO [Parasphaerochaeta coccoides]|uniref:DNA repair protein RecO n=1 Tax=Parasphaerochaeta coccoides (strain ATCC BAA-1237 / DSM 17374 / SPN1) TaxID=760011 RepID=F4GHT7_PARC1|nr:DNA repair protein RecO [Parasphaerochaeta coccoides]AEC01625.1 DNA repair protein RecO [Parasphaerochaeta coccoides DSM 17374]
MDRDLTVDGIVLRTRRMGDMHRRLSLLCPDLGIIDVIAYGARKGKRAMNAQMFSRSTFFLYHNPVRKEYTLKDARMESPHDGVRSRLDSMWAASFWSELCTRTAGGDWNALFLLLSECLDALEEDPSSVERASIQFVWHLLHLAGIAPDLTRCPVSERVYTHDEILGFSASLLSPCSRENGDVDDMLLPPGARRYLAMTAGRAVREAVAVQLNDITALRIRRYMVRYAHLFAGGHLMTVESGFGMMDMDDESGNVSNEGSGDGSDDE